MNFKVLFFLIFCGGGLIACESDLKKEIESLKAQLKEVNTPENINKLQQEMIAKQREWFNAKKRRVV